jgi:hypothetical protein
LSHGAGSTLFLENFIKCGFFKAFGWRLGAGNTIRGIGLERYTRLGSLFGFLLDIFRHGHR